MIRWIQEAWTFTVIGVIEKNLGHTVESANVSIKVRSLGN